MFATLVAAAIAQSVQNGPSVLDAESKRCMELLVAAVDAARSAHSGFSAQLAYACEASPHVTSYIKPENVAGTIRWDGTRVMYSWNDVQPPGAMAVAVLRDANRYVRAVRHDRQAGASYYTFEVRPPLASLRPLSAERLSVGDPARWFGGSTLGVAREALASGTYSNPQLRRTGSDIEFRVSTPNGSIRTMYFEAVSGFLPIRAELLNPTDKDATTSKEEMAWSNINGKWFLKRSSVHRRWLDGPTKTPAEAKFSLSFTDVKVDEKFADADFSLDRLPVPVGAALGIDKRNLPVVGLIRDTSGIVPRERSSTEAQEAAGKALRRSNVQAAAHEAAERAAAERRNYQWRLAGKICGGLAVLAVGGAVFWRRQRAGA